MKYASTVTTSFTDDDGDVIVLKEEPTGSQYDQRVRMLGNMRIPANMISDNTNMEDLFSGGEMIEIAMDKEALAEFQFKTLFVEMTTSGRRITSISEAIGEYRRFNMDTKEWVDGKVDSIWRRHEEATAEVQRVEGESAD